MKTVQISSAWFLSLPKYVLGVSLQSTPPPITAHFPTDPLTNWCSISLPDTYINSSGNEGKKKNFKVGEYFWNWRERGGKKPFSLSLVMREIQTSRYTDVSKKLEKNSVRVFGEMDTPTVRLTGTGFLESALACVPTFNISDSRTSGLEKLYVWSVRKISYPEMFVVEA